jgi:hypothetical protein
MLLFGLGLAVIVATGALFVIRPPRVPVVGLRPTVAASPEASIPPRMATADLYAAFEASGAGISFGTPTTLSTVRAGDLVLPTGRVVAADVFFFQTEPFIRTLPAGRYPVQLLMSARDPSVAGDVAAAMIRAAPGDPVSWELAIVPGQDPTTLKADEFFGYGVDSGTGCFASAEAVAVLTANRFDAYADRVQQGMFPSDGVYNASVDVTVDPVTGVNVIGFASGFGDGAYPSWFGLDSGGDPLVLLTDFGILDAPS